MLVSAPIAIFGGLCLLVVRRTTRLRSIIRAQLAAYRQGDYRGQLQIVEQLKTGSSEPPYYLFFHGAACYQLGRLQEAERALRQSLSAETNARLRTVCRDELGRVLMAQERWEEAEACFHDCITEFPRRGGGHRAIAELRLRRGGERQAALDEARSAVAADRAERAGRGKLAKEDNSANLGESLAFFAWALAENQADSGEVEKTLNEAFSVCGEGARPILAELHFCAGHAYAALGDAAESSRHFHCATGIDPDGNYGRLSRSVQAVISTYN